MRTKGRPRRWQPHLMLLAGRWEVMWFDKQAQRVHPPDHVAWMTRHSESARLAYAHAAARNQREARGAF